MLKLFLLLYEVLDNGVYFFIGIIGYILMFLFKMFLYIKMKFLLYIKIINIDIFLIKVFYNFVWNWKNNKEKLIFIFCVIIIILCFISFCKYIVSLYECGKVFIIIY